MQVHLFTSCLLHLGFVDCKQALAFLPLTVKILFVGDLRAISTDEGTYLGDLNKNTRVGVDGLTPRVENLHRHQYT